MSSAYERRNWSHRVSSISNVCQSVCSCGLLWRPEPSSLPWWIFNAISRNRRENVVNTEYPPPNTFLTFVHWICHEWCWCENTVPKKICELWIFNYYVFFFKDFFLLWFLFYVFPPSGVYDLCLVSSAVSVRDASHVFGSGQFNICTCKHHK